MSTTLPAPLSAWVEEPNGYNGPLMLLGMSDLGEWFGVADDGHLRYASPAHITIDWRYDWRNHQWIEVSDIGIEEEPSDDGGSELPGSVPDADAAGVGDQVDEEGRSTAGGPWGVDPGETGGEDGE